MASSKKAAEENQPNVAFVGRDKNGKTDVSLALDVINIGTTGKIHLPKPDDQAKPFYHENAEELTAAMPHLYKPFNSDKKAKG